MATRYYFPETEVADVSPTISTTDWFGGHIQTTRRQLRLTPDASALLTTSFPSEAGHHTNANSHHRQYVSDPLGAQAISGDVKAQFQCNEQHSNNQQFLTIKVWVCSGDGSIERGVLLAVQRDDVEIVGFNGTGNSENRSFGSYSLSSVNAQDGDRLVVEVGTGGQPIDIAGTQNHNCWIRWGCSAANGDLPEDNSAREGVVVLGINGNTYRPWIEFTDVIAEETFVASTSSAIFTAV